MAEPLLTQDGAVIGCESCSLLVATDHCNDCGYTACEDCFELQQHGPGGCIEDDPHYQPDPGGFGPGQCVCAEWDARGWSICGMPCPDHPPTGRCPTPDCKAKTHRSTLCLFCENKKEKADA